ncbi:MAG TPA: hypothetical protein VFF52_18225, partial [Isosphaeraceae bacterium]|nr:hypothetical protein [Isosphaeraceae bacterium]
AFGHRIAAAVVSDGSYEVPRGLVFGFPLVTADGQTWTIAQNQYLDEPARRQIAVNVAELQHEASILPEILKGI